MLVKDRQQCIHDDIVPRKNKNISFMQTIFRGAYWLRGTYNSMKMKGRIFEMQAKQ